MSTNTEDESFHPLGSEWEAELTEMLDETEYDTELGLAMAEDAQRLVAGELTEAEFHEKYHEDVLEEFDVDDRPTGEAYEEAVEAAENDGSFLDVLGRFDGDGEEGRRNVMKKMGAGAAFLGLGAMATAENGDPGAGALATAAETEEDNDGTQWGMTIDLERCDACLSCVVGCQQENGLDQGVNWMYVLQYEDPTSQSDSRNRLVRPCQHCTDAPCEKVCPTTARHTRSKDGLVLTDYDVCIGCRYCQVACPYGVNYFQWGEPEVPRDEIADDHYYDERGRPVDSRAPRGVMSKCTMCPSRQDGNQGEERIGTTACEDACPPGAIQFGDMNDPDSDPQRYIDNVALARAKEASSSDEDIQQAIAILDGEEEPADDDDGDGMTEEMAQRLIQGEYGTSDSTFRLLEDIGTNPNVVYIGNEPGPNAEQVPGPVAYEDVGLTDNRKEVLDEKTVDGGLSL